MKFEDLKEGVYLQYKNEPFLYKVGQKEGLFSDKVSLYFKGYKVAEIENLNKYEVSISYKIFGKYSKIKFEKKFNFKVIAK